MDTKTETDVLRVFTANERIIAYQAGKLKSKKITEVIDQLIEVFKK